jgi:catechol 2,3-dioxygenase-like lactoylglutathione lyase family enzyme
LSTASERVEFLSAVLLHSADPPRLAGFYRDVLGLPLKEERHGNAPPHFGCELGDVHFAIHPTTAPIPSGPIKLAFMVFDLKHFVNHLAAGGIELLYTPRPLGPGSTVTAVTDPDGNEIELTEMSAQWFSHLAEHRAGGADVLIRAQPEVDQ